jgi:diaminopimelate decarboxylase
MAQLAHDEGLLLDVATGGEMFVALNAGVPADRLVMHGNNKNLDELRMALTAGDGRGIRCEMTARLANPGAAPLQG